MGDADVYGGDDTHAGLIRTSESRRFVSAITHGCAVRFAVTSVRATRDPDFEIQMGLRKAIVGAQVDHPAAT